MAKIYVTLVSQYFCKRPSGVTDCFYKTKSFSIFQPPPTHPPFLQVKRIPIK